MEDGRNGITVLVALEPRSYREAIGETLQALRPRHRITSVEPCALRGEILRLRPELVLADGPNDILPDGTPAWVEYAPYDDAPARVCVGGRRRELHEVGLEDLLAALESAEPGTSSAPETPRP